MIEFMHPSHSNAHKWLPRLVLPALALASTLSQPGPALAKHSNKQTTTTEEKQTSAKETKNGALAAEIHIRAPIQTVWEAIHEERESAPGLAYSKVLAHDNNHFRIEQKYTIIPFISSVTRVLDINETPNERIDYEVIVTGEEKPLKGSWVLKSEDTENTSTLLTLSALSQRIDKNPIKRELGTIWLKRRLEHVKEFAERSQKLSLKGKVLPKSEK